MTQEELDAMMAGGIEEIKEDDTPKSEEDHHSDMAEQLGSVTKESEVKATEIFDKLESILTVTESLKESQEDMDEKVANIESIVMDIMSTMQYQDIHRQKIERVINNMRSISKLMNQTLHIVDDEDIAPSAKHIDGDDTADVVSDEELEALIASMNNK